MATYMLPEEKKLLNRIAHDLEKRLRMPMDEVKRRLNFLLLHNKDASIEDFLKDYDQLFVQDFQTFLDKNLAPSMQFGIQNEYFSFVHQIQKEGYAYSLDTMYSFDSISKLALACVVMLEKRKGNLDLNNTVHEINSDFACDASIKSILDFSAMLQTEKRIDNLSKDETIQILKECKENLLEKKKRKNYYQYNDIGYMILRLAIPHFIEHLDALLTKIDKENLTIYNEKNKERITGGKQGEEYVTPDRKGRGIFFPGHTGLYGNIQGLLSFVYQLFCTENILSFEERQMMLQQPYMNPIVYNKDGYQQIGKNGSLQYMCKVSGVYRKPLGVYDDTFSKMAACDMSSCTTDFGIATTGTCGSWGVTDILTTKNKFGPYAGGILTNPYAYVKKDFYPNDSNVVPNTNLIVNKNGVINGYSGKLNPYKDMISNYGLLLVLLTEYFKQTDFEALQDASLKRKKEKLPH